MSAFEELNSEEFEKKARIWASYGLDRQNRENLFPISGLRTELVDALHDRADELYDIFHTPSMNVTQSTNGMPNISPGLTRQGAFIGSSNNPIELSGGKKYSTRSKPKKGKSKKGKSKKGKPKKGKSKKGKSKSKSRKNRSIRFYITSI